MKTTKTSWILVRDLGTDERPPMGETVMNVRKGFVVAIAFAVVMALMSSPHAAIDIHSNGLYITPYHLGFTNAAQTDEDIETVLETARRVLTQITELG